MQRALVCLNFWGCEAVGHKLKNTLKTPKMHFLPVFELMSDSLTATKVETNQCTSHQSILLTQGPIYEIFTKNIQNWQSWKTQFFWVGHFEFEIFYMVWTKIWRLPWVLKITHANLYQHHCIFIEQIFPPSLLFLI